MTIEAETIENTLDDGFPERRVVIGQYRVEAPRLLGECGLASNIPPELNDRLKEIGRVTALVAFDEPTTCVMGFMSACPGEEDEAMMELASMIMRDKSPLFRGAGLGMHWTCAYRPHQIVVDQGFRSGDAHLKECLAALDIELVTERDSPDKRSLVEALFRQIKWKGGMPPHVKVSANADPLDAFELLTSVAICHDYNNTQLPSLGGNTPAVALGEHKLRPVPTARDLRIAIGSETCRAVSDTGAFDLRGTAFQFSGGVAAAGVRTVKFDPMDLSTVSVAVDGLWIDVSTVVGLNPGTPLA